MFYLFWEKINSFVWQTKQKWSQANWNIEAFSNSKHQHLQGKYFWHFLFQKSFHPDLENDKIVVVFQFQKSSEHSLFSNSVVDVFTQLTQCFDVVSKLECPDPEIWKRYMKRFAKTISKVLIAYADITKDEFPNQMKDERIVSCCFQVYVLLKVNVFCFQIMFCCIGYAVKG